MTEILTPMGEEDVDEWLPIDTIFCVLILLFISVVISIVAKIAWLYLCKKKMTESKEQVKKTPSHKPAKWFVQLSKPRSMIESVHE